MPPAKAAQKPQDADEGPEGTDGADEAPEAPTELQAPVSGATEAALAGMAPVGPVTLPSPIGWGRSAAARPTGELHDERGDPIPDLEAILVDTGDGHLVAAKAVYEWFLPRGVAPTHPTQLLLIPAGRPITRQFVDSLQIGTR